MEIADTDYKKTGVVSDCRLPTKLYTDNHLISTLKKSEYYYDQAKGMAYGYTSAGGYCLISAAPTGKNSPAYLVVLMGGKNEKNQPIPTFVDAKNLLTWAIDTYELRTIAKGARWWPRQRSPWGKRPTISPSPPKAFQLILPGRPPGTPW
jgi:D-alanyl-D-alanine carboxypeptidase